MQPIEQPRAAGGVSLIRMRMVLMALPFLAACTVAPEGAEIHDPYERHNRQVHALNVDVDRIALRGSASAYGTGVPRPVRRGIGNAADNLAQPRRVLNSLLQFRLEDAITNTYRFVLNSTVGVAGVFDPAGALGITAREADFGETLFVWGVPEGAYLELPFLGPATERRAVGHVADFALDPLHQVLAVRQRNRALAVRAAGLVDQRERASTFLESTLYESADSYAQARLMYLQNRRFAIGDDAQTQFIDPYEDDHED